MIEVVLAGVFGLLIGSFLNVCIHRLPEDQSVLNPRRSYCPECKRMIAWYDNIPLLSFVILKGRCRNCTKRISWRYPLVEALTAALFAWSVYAHGWSLMGLKYCVFSAILVDLVFTDLETYILPDEFTYGGAAVGLVLAAFTPSPAPLFSFFMPRGWPAWGYPVMDAAFSGIVVAGMLWITGAVYLKARNWYLCRKLYRRIRKKRNAPYLRASKNLYSRIRKRLPRLVRVREVLGLGDVKMLLAIGVFLGLPDALLTIFVGSVLGSVVGAIYIRSIGKTWDYEIPFGSFLGLAAILVGMFSDAFFKWYWKLG